MNCEFLEKPQLYSKRRCLTQIVSINQGLLKLEVVCSHADLSGSFESSVTVAFVFPGQQEKDICMERKMEP